jgi:hypothetical protein
MLNVQYSFLIIRAKTVTLFHITQSALWGMSCQFQKWTPARFIIMWIFYFLYMCHYWNFILVTFMVVCASWLCSKSVCYVAFALGLKCFFTLVVDTSDHVTRLYAFICCGHISSYTCEVGSNGFIQIWVWVTYWGVLVFEIRVWKWGLVLPNASLNEVFSGLMFLSMNVKNFLMFQKWISKTGLS